MAAIATLNVCGVFPPSWPSWLASFGACVILANVAISFILTGIVIRADTKYHSAFSVFIFYILFAVMVLLARTFNWLRPSYLPACVASADNIFGDILNRNAFPDAFFLTNVAFSLFYLFATILVEKRPKPYLLMVLGSIYYVLFSIFEIASQRLDAWQFVCNVLLIIVATFALLVVAWKYTLLFPGTEAFLAQPLQLSDLFPGTTNKNSGGGGGPSRLRPPSARNVL